MKKLSCLSLLSIIILTGCTHRIADVTLISTRNYESNVKYVELKKYQKGKDRALHSILWFGPLGAPDIEDAVDVTVKQVEGGEHLRNVVIKERYNFFFLFTTRVFIVEGDVWGLGTGSVNHIITKTPIKAGDEVMWNGMFNKIHKGKVLKVMDGNPVKLQIMEEINGKKKLKKRKVEKVTKTETTNKNSTTQNNNEVVVEDVKPNTTPNKSKSDKQIYKTVSELKMREEADISSDMILVLNKGAEVELIEKTNSSWWKVKYAGVIGYVSSKYLSKQ